MKILCILSGGMDSTTMLFGYLKEGKTVEAITFDYGQRHMKEIEYAKRFCQDYGIAHHIIDLTSISTCLSGSSLTSDIAVPEGHYADESMKNTVVPNRNLIMAVIATARAISRGFDAIALGVHGGDHAIYPDCRPEFIAHLNQLNTVSNYKAITVLAPYLNKNKIDIARDGLTLGLDYDKYTWTCYKGLDAPCGKCGSCIEREEALRLAR